jgi:hypothetical protein
VQTFDKILAEDANSDKVCGVKKGKNLKNFKNLEKRGSEAWLPLGDIRLLLLNIFPHPKS